MRLFWDLDVSLRSFRWDWAGYSFLVFYSGVLSQEGPFFIGILNIGTSFENEFWTGQTVTSLCRFNFDI